LSFKNIQKFIVMIRKNCIALILFLATCSVFGQDFKFGILFDPTITWLNSDVNDVTREKARLGLDLGMSVDYFFTRNYAFSTGISLFNMGGTLRYGNGITKFRTKDGLKKVGLGGDVKYKLQYLKIPVAIKFKTHRIGQFIYSANLGFDPMFRVASRANFDDVTDPENPVKLKNSKVNQEIKLMNLGWHFGLEVHYSLGQDAALFSGFSFLKTFTDITVRGPETITSSNLMLRIGVLF